MGHLARMQTLPTLWTETESRFILPAHGASCSHIIELLTSHLYHFIENTHGQPIRIQKSRCIIYSSELVQPSHHALCLCRVDCVGHCMFYGMVNNLIQKRTFLRKYACWLVKSCVSITQWRYHWKRFKTSTYFSNIFNNRSQLFNWKF